MHSPRKASVRSAKGPSCWTSLLEVSAATTQTLDLDHLLASVAEIIQKVLAYDLFAILLYNERRRDLRIPLWRGPSRGCGRDSR